MKKMSVILSIIAVTKYSKARFVLSIDDYIKYCKETPNSG